MLRQSLFKAQVTNLHRLFVKKYKLTFFNQLKFVTRARHKQSELAK
jgi:hypothetical protein